MCPLNHFICLPHRPEDDEPKNILNGIAIDQPKQCPYWYIDPDKILYHWHQIGHEEIVLYSPVCDESIKSQIYCPDQIWSCNNGLSNQSSSHIYHNWIICNCHPKFIDWFDNDRCNFVDLLEENRHSIYHEFSYWLCELDDANDNRCRCTHYWFYDVLLDYVAMRICII